MKIDKWEPIETIPKDGREVIVLINCATVPIVRTAWFIHPDEMSKDEWEHGYGADTSYIGWWSYRNSVGQEKLSVLEQPIGWLPLPMNTHDLV